MSTALTFDTHEFFVKLKNVGFSDDQATVITELQKTAINVTLDQAKHDYDLENITSKRDIELLELNLKHEIREVDLKIELVKSELKRDIAETKAELVRWVVGVGLLQITIITGLVLKLTGHV